MIVVAGHLVIEPSKLAPVMEDVRKLEDVTRTEDGNLYYAMSVNDPAKGHVTVVEKWRDQAALDAHFGTANFQAFLAKNGAFITAIEAKIYDVNGARDIVIPA